MGAIIESEASPRADAGAVPEQLTAASGARLAFRALPWALVVVTLIAALLWVHTPETHIARYAAYWVLWVALPGTLLYRALRGSTGNLPEDVGYGSAAGLAVHLVAWAPLVGAGARSRAA